MTREENETAWLFWKGKLVGTAEVKTQFHATKNKAVPIAPRALPLSYGTPHLLISRTTCPSRSSDCSSLPQPHYLILISLNHSWIVSAIFICEYS